MAIKTVYMWCVCVCMSFIKCIIFIIQVLLRFFHDQILRSAGSHTLQVHAYDKLAIQFHFSKNRRHDNTISTNEAPPLYSNHDDKNKTSFYYNSGKILTKWQPSWKWRPYCIFQVAHYLSFLNRRRTHWWKFHAKIPQFFSPNCQTTNLMFRMATKTQWAALASTLFS